MQADVDPEALLFAREVARQHRQLRRLMQDVLAAEDDRCEEAWHRLRCYLAAHEAAERLAMHSMFRARDRDDPSVVDRLAEEDDIARAIGALDGAPAVDGWFRAPLVAVCELLTAHAEREERDELPGFLHRITDDDATELLEVLLLVERTRDALQGPGASFSELLERADDELDRLLVESRTPGNRPG